MTVEDPNGGVIRYTTKELLAEIRQGISDIKHTTDNHEGRIRDLEVRNAEYDRQRMRDNQLRGFVWTKLNASVALFVGLLLFAVQFYLAVKPH